MEKDSGQMAKQVDRQALAMEYLNLLKSGVPASEAFKQVYPNGIPTAAQQQQADAKAKQGSALAGTGGTIAGLLGIKYGSKALESLGSTGTAALPSAGAANAFAGAQAGAQAGLANSAGATSSGLAFPSVSMATAGPIAAALGGTYLGGKAGLDMIQGKKPGLPGRVILGMATGGLSEVGNALFNRESTRDRQNKKLNSLLESGVMNSDLPGENGIIQDMGHGDKELYSGQLKGRDVWGVSGMFDTFDKDWLNKYSEGQRENISQRLLDERLLDSKKGLTRIVDQDRARAIAAEEIGKKQQAVTRPVVGNIPPAQPAISDALAKKQLAQTGVFGNKLLEAIQARK